MYAKRKESSVRRHTRRKRAADCLWVKKTEVKWRDFSLWVAAGLKCSILRSWNESRTYRRDQTKLPQLASDTIMSHVPGPVGHAGGNFHVVDMNDLWVCNTQIFRRTNSLCCIKWWYRNHVCPENIDYIRTFALTQKNLLAHMNLFDSKKMLSYIHIPLS